MKIYLATWLFEVNQAVALTNRNQKNRLLSYYHTAQIKNLDLRKYVKTGKQ